MTTQNKVVHCWCLCWSLHQWEFNITEVKASHLVLRLDKDLEGVFVQFPHSVIRTCPFDVFQLRFHWRIGTVLDSKFWVLWHTPWGCQERECLLSVWCDKIKIKTSQTVPRISLWDQYSNTAPWHSKVPLMVSHTPPRMTQYLILSCCLCSLSLFSEVLASPVTWKKVFLNGLGLRNNNKTNKQAKEDKEKSGIGDRLLVSYFRNTHRCASCFLHVLSPEWNEWNSEANLKNCDSSLSSAKIPSVLQQHVHAALTRR